MSNDRRTNPRSNQTFQDNGGRRCHPELRRRFSEKLNQVNAGGDPAFLPAMAALIRYGISHGVEL